MDILDFFWTFYLNHLSPLWGYFFLSGTVYQSNSLYIFHQRNWNYFGIRLYLETEKIGKIYFPKLLSLINHLP